MAVCLDLFTQLCDALSALHNKGIVHRDLKPSNVMLSNSGSGIVVKLVDLGIAKVLSTEESGHRLTKAGEVFGSPSYMSPEQCRGFQVDARSDMYSLGCMMYEALTGSPPFEGSDIYNLMWRHINEPPSRVPFLSPSNQVPQLLQGVIFRLLNKNPDRRFQSADELKQELARFNEKIKSEVT